MFEHTRLPMGPEPSGAGPIRFDGEAAIVTGAGHGLGRSYAMELAARGAAVLCNDVVRGAAETTATAINDHGGVAVVDSTSVASPAGGDAIVQHAVDAFGAVHIVINNAGQLRNASIDEMTIADFGDVIETHLGGAFYVTQPAYLHMKRAGYGRIVFTSSAAGMFGSPWQANYAAAKAGIVGLCNVVALEGAAHGIRANAVMPMALTGIGGDGPPPFAPDQLEETIDALRPLAAHMTVENVAPLVVYLASRRCGHTRRVFSVGAGRVAEVFVGVSRGWYAPGLDGMTPEGVASHLDVVSDRAGFAVPESMNDECRFIAAHMPDTGQSGSAV